MPPDFNVYEGAGTRRIEVLDEAGGEGRVENDVYLFREDQVQSVQA